jgi:phosphoribosylformylglycinamidine synthase
MLRALVIRTAGTNCDAEMVRAFQMAGAGVDLVHVDRLIEQPRRIDDCDLIGFPGGFSYGDDVASGRILAMKLREHLYPALRSAAIRGVPMIGVCNGFQVLVQVGLLPGPMGGGGEEKNGGGGGSGGGKALPRPLPGGGEGGAGDREGWPVDRPPAQSVGLAENAGARFVDRWVGAVVEPESVCLWTCGISDDGLVLPVAHGEGRFVARSPDVLDALERHGQVALRYTDNFNGSQRAIAGICDRTGRIFGLMPHPERFLDWTRHPFWTRLDAGVRDGETPGLRMFRNAVEAA